MAKVTLEASVEEGPLPVAYEAGEWLFYLKLVGVGPETMKETGGQPLGKIGSVPGHLLVGTPEDLRQALHQAVDDALQKQFGGESNGSTQQEAE